MIMMNMIEIELELRIVMIMNITKSYRDYNEKL